MSNACRTNARLGLGLGAVFVRKEEVMSVIQVLYISEGGVGYYFCEEGTEDQVVCH